MIEGRRWQVEHGLDELTTYYFLLSTLKEEGNPAKRGTDGRFSAAF
jgi:hypothetical protein